MKARSLLGGLCFGLSCWPMFGLQIAVVQRASDAPPTPLLAAFSSSNPTLLASVLKLPAAPDLPDMLELSVQVQAPAPNAFDRHNFTAAAIKSAFRRENMVKMAENFVPGQPLPDAPAYVPLSSRQKFDRFLRNSYSPGLVSGVVFDSLIAQASGAYPSFGGGMAGYGRRLAASAAGTEAGAFIGGFVFPTLLHQDPRYFRSTSPNTSGRLAYAASRVLITRSDDGRNVLNTSLILSEFTEAALANAYIPYRRETVAGTLENALANLQSVAEAHMLDEFWPDIKTFLTKHEPKPLQHLHKRQDAGGMNQIAAQ